MKIEDLLPFPAERLLDLLADQVGWVRHCLGEGRRKEWAPALAVVSVAGPGEEEELAIYALLVPFNEDHEKRAAMLALGRTVCDTRRFPVAAVLTSEAWWSTQRKGAPPMKPGDDPARKEVIIAAGRTLGGLMGMTHVGVTRDAGGFMVPDGDDEEIVTNCEVNILGHFFDGFMLAAAEVARRRNTN